MGQDKQFSQRLSENFCYRFSLSSAVVVYLLCAVTGEVF